MRPASPSVRPVIVSVNDSMPWENGRQISIKASLFQDGSLISEITHHSTNFLYGCRGYTLLIGSDANGSLIWDVKLRGKTAGGVCDLFTSSLQKVVRKESIDAERARETRQVHVYYHILD